jgi:hypothetical protein
MAARLLAAAGLTALVAAAAAAVPSGSPAVAAPAVCTGDTSASQVKAKPGPRLRFGINPAGVAGALGPPVTPAPDHPAKTLAALAKLRPPDRPLYLRLNRFFWSDGAAGVRAFAKLTRRYTRRGYPVELQLRYHPRPDQEGRIARWGRFVQHVVKRFGRNPLVVGIQVTNEVNFLPIAPDASDAAFAGAKDALIHGVEIAHDVARRLGYGQLGIGFNWAYRNDPASEEQFWTYLRDHGGPRFVRSVDWVGLDAYPGTFFPPAEPLPGGYRDGMVNAMSVLRDCFMPIANIPRSVPMHVEENGYPTGVGRSEATQVEAMREMVGAVNRFRGTYNVTDYRWFDLRDHLTSDPNFQRHYGLLTDDYEPKPAFGTYRRLVARLAHR